ncbi:MAG: hypothetical protein ABIR26_19110 [Ramlibacter sp.]
MQKSIEMTQAKQTQPEQLRRVERIQQNPGVARPARVLAKAARCGLDEGLNTRR